MSAGRFVDKLRSDAHAGRIDRRGKEMGLSLKLIILNKGQPLFVYPIGFTNLTDQILGAAFLQLAGFFLRLRLALLQH